MGKQVWIGRSFRRREGVSPDDQLANFRLYAGLSSLVFCIQEAGLFKDDIPNLLSASFFNQGLTPIFTAGSADRIISQHMLLKTVFSTFPFRHKLKDKAGNQRPFHAILYLDGS